jgi:DNA-binding NarL/FixJ family response regulator
VRVVIAEDSVLMREGLARVLTEGGCEVVAQAADAPSLLRAVRNWRPDVAVVDVRMPPTQTREGAEAAQQIRTITLTSPCCSSRTSSRRRMPFACSRSVRRASGIC